MLRAPARAEPSPARSTNVETETSNASGVATASTFTANGNSGSYTFTASAVVSGTNVSASFFLTNTGFTVAATSGTPQTVKTGTAFASLQATVAINGSPVFGASVTFTAPASGAGGIFATTNTKTVTVRDQQLGRGDRPGFHCQCPVRQLHGCRHYTGAINTATFSLTNSAAGVPTSITVVAGTPQSAPVGTIFPTQFQASVTDVNSNPVGGVNVTFSAPSGGAGGHLLLHQLGQRDRRHRIRRDSGRPALCRQPTQPGPTRWSPRLRGCGRSRLLTNSP